MFKKKKNLDADSFEKAIKAIKEKAQQNKAWIIDSVELTPEEQKYFQDRLYQMIQYAVGRYDWYDEQRNRFLQIGLTLLAVASAAAAALTQVRTDFCILAKVCVWLSLLSLFVTGIILLLIYNRDVEKNHPYRKIADIKSWYFVYNIPKKMTDNLSSNIKIAQEQVENVEASMKEFVNRVVTTAKEPRGFIKEDLEQVFILQLLQRYKFQQVKKLSAILTWGILITVIFVVIAIILILIFGGNYQKKAEIIISITS